MSANSEEAREAWMAALRRSAAESTLSADDPVREAATHAHDSFYEKLFEVKQSLGVTLAQHGEWAVVKVSNEAESGISIGSVLSGVNGRSVITSSYKDAVELLRGWQPPLTLTFRRAPSKSGVLSKLSLEAETGVRQWHIALSQTLFFPRFFVSLLKG